MPESGKLGLGTSKVQEYTRKGDNSEIGSNVEYGIVNRHKRPGYSKGSRAESITSRESDHKQAFDPINPLVESIHDRQFYHPYAHTEVGTWDSVRNRIFELLEQIYFFFQDLVI